MNYTFLNNSNTPILNPVNNNQGTIGATNDEERLYIY